MLTEKRAEGNRPAWFSRSMNSWCYSWRSLPRPWPPRNHQEFDFWSRSMRTAGWNVAHSMFIEKPISTWDIGKQYTYECNFTNWGRFLLLNLNFIENITLGLRLQLTSANRWRCSYKRLRNYCSPFLESISCWNLQGATEESSLTFWRAHGGQAYGVLSPKPLVV